MNKTFITKIDYLGPHRITTTGEASSNYTIPSIGEWGINNISSTKENKTSDRSRTESINVQP